MAQTLEELSEILENMQVEADKNAAQLNKALTSINTHLEGIENDTETDDLIKVYLTEYKKALEDRHALVISEFSNVQNSIKNIESKQSELTQSKDFERFFAILTNNLQFLQNEFNSQQNSIENLNKAIVNMSEDNSDKNEIISAINASKQEFEITNSHFEEYMTNISADTQNILKNLIVMDPTAQNDIVKRELENIYIAVNSVLTSIHETEQKNDNLISAIQNIITRENLENVQDTISKTITESGDRINNLLNQIEQKVDDIALANNNSDILYEFNNIKQLLNEQKEEFIGNFDTDQLSVIETKLSEAVNIINSIKNEDLQNNTESISQVIAQTFDMLSNKIEAIDTVSITNAISQVKDQATEIDEKLNSLAHQSDLADLYSSIKEFSEVLDTLKASLSTSNEHTNILIKDKLESFTSILSEVVSGSDFANFRHELADFIQQIVDNSNSLNQNLSIQKDVLENLINRIESFEISKNLDSLTFALDQIRENSSTNRDSIINEIHNIPQQINDNTDAKISSIDEKISQSTTDIKNLQNDILIKLDENQEAEKFQGIHNNIDLLRDTITSAQNSNEAGFNEKISDLKNIINDGLSSRNERFEQIQSCFDTFKAEINNFIATYETNSCNNISTINDIKSKIEDVAQVFTDWNYNQESRDSKLVSMISTEIESLSNAMAELQSEVQTELHGELSANSDTLKQQVNALISHIEDLKTQISNANQDEQFESVKAKIENSGELINNNINLLKDIVSSSMNDNVLFEKLIAIRDIIVENGNSTDETIKNLQEKIDEFINVGNRISSETEIKIGNSVSELADLKNEIADISSSFKNWDYNREDHDNKMVGMISTELDELKNSITTLQDSVQTGIHQELNRNSEAIETQLNNIIGYVDTLKDELRQNIQANDQESVSREGLQDISDKINAVKQELNLVNTDIMDTINSNAEALMTEINPLKSALDSIVEIKDSITSGYEALQDASKNTELLNAIGEIKNFINEKIQTMQQNNDEIKNAVNVAMNNDELKWSIDEFKDTVGARISESSNSINEMLNTLNQKMDILASSDNAEFQYDIEDIKNMISSQRELLENTDSNKLSAIEDKLKELTDKLDNVDSSEMNNMKESIIEAIINVFEQISFIEESEDIKDFVEEKTDEINQNINEVKKQLTQFVNGEDDYSYTLQDVESDIAKLRLVLNDLSNTSSQEEISDISDNIHRIVTTVEGLQASLTQEEVTDLKSNFEKLSEDVLSISSRTNKLLLTSDESYNALSNGLNDFSNVITQLEERINYLDNKEISERIEEKLDNTYNIVTSSANSDKVMRQALMYMGEWIDTTSENIESLCENTDIQKHKSEEIVSLLDELKETLPEQRQLLDTITVHFDEQQERMDRLEMKLEKILAAIENIDDTKLVNKVDKIDKQVKKLSTTIEKLATYVDE